MRKVTVYSTKGKTNAEITTDVTTWGELRELLISEHGYEMDSLNATENINRTDLINTGANLPEGEFTLFLRPVKTKSGNGLVEVTREYLVSTDFKGLREAIKSLPQDLKEDYVKSLRGENYTHFTTAKLRVTLIDFFDTLVLEEEVVELENNCDKNPIDVLQVLVDTLECINVSQDNSEISERCHIIYDEMEGISNVLNEEVDLKKVALDEEALDILKGYNS
tara:strand:- start:5630 stop:6295 length:666 start_codon:yes stop_codon:yes gene_type:complete